MEEDNKLIITLLGGQ